MITSNNFRLNIHTWIHSNVWWKKNKSLPFTCIHVWFFFPLCGCIVKGWSCFIPRAVGQKQSCVSPRESYNSHVNSLHPKSTYTNGLYFVSSILCWGQPLQKLHTSWHKLRPVLVISFIAVPLLSSKEGNDTALKQLLSQATPFCFMWFVQLSFHRWIKWWENKVAKRCKVDASAMCGIK